MKKFEILRIEECEKSNFIKPQSIIYRLGEEEKKWDMVKVHDSVSILVYHEENKSLLIVKQFRPAVFMHSKMPFTYELCAGIMDKNLPSMQTAIEEVSEELGFCVENLEEITSFFTAVGFAGAKQKMYFARVNESLRVGPGGGDASEDIEVVQVHEDEVEKFIYDENIVTTSGLKFAFLWFLNWKEKHKDN